MSPNMNMKNFFNLFDVVRLIKTHGKLSQGTVGNIVEKLNRETSLVEFCDKQGRTLDLISLSGNEMLKLKKDQALVAA